ncbi:MAG: serine protease [Pyrinomonadaceae bacterium]|nr:serine protease [Pyrinomonadaceae bacterium]
MENVNDKSNGLSELSDDLTAAVEKVSARVVAINARPRVASSGVMWRPGVVVSANHTIRRDEEITITLPDNRTVSATLAGRDGSTDLAILKIENNETQAIEVSAPAEIKVGQLVLAVGRTGGEGVSASLGIVNAVRDAWRTWRGGVIDKFVRLDLNIHLGFSGSPLVDAKGSILGINTSGLARGSAISIPNSTVDRVVDELLTRGSIARAYIGVGMHPVYLPDALRIKLNLEGRSGVIVLSVEPNAPAEKAGLLLGDVMVALDDTPVGDTADVQRLLAPKRVGQEIKAAIIRGGELMELTITVGDRPQRSRRRG